MSFISRWKESIKNSMKILQEVTEANGKLSDLSLRVQNIQNDLLRNFPSRVHNIQSDLRYLELRKTSQLDTMQAYKNSWGGKRFEQLHKLLEIKDIVGDKFEFIRVGKEYDGGYTMINDFDETIIAYSYGISNDVSWDQAMADHKIHSYMYDHTISALPYENPFFHWKKEGVCGKVKIDNCASVDTHLKVNGHNLCRNLILKMDVEGAEWDVLMDIKPETLSQFKQIVFEFHDMYSPQLFSKICKVLSKLNETHQCVHVHGNNCGPSSSIAGMVMPYAIEILYVRKEDYKFVPSHHFYPREFDMPCNPNVDEIILGYWNLES